MVLVRTIKCNDFGYQWYATLMCHKTPGNGPHRRTLAISVLLSQQTPKWAMGTHRNVTQRI